MRIAGEFFRQKGVQSRPIHATASTSSPTARTCSASTSRPSRSSRSSSPAWCSWPSPTRSPSTAYFGIFLGHTFIVTDDRPRGRRRLAAGDRGGDRLTDAARRDGIHHFRQNPGDSLAPARGSQPLDPAQTPNGRQCDYGAPTTPVELSKKGFGRRWNGNVTHGLSGFFHGCAGELQDERRYRVFADLERLAGRFPRAKWHSPHGPRDVVIWCSNDYLGMGQHPKVVGAMIETATRMGTGAGGTRNIAGTNHPLVELERELADLHRKEAALVFTSGYVSNETGISTLAKLIPNCLILSDALNHNSMIEGVRQSHCEKQIFRHNDMAHLEELLPRPMRSAEADRVREPLLHGRRRRADAGDLRSRAALRRHDLYRRGARRRHVRAARRRHRRARWRHAPHRRDRRHARQGVRLPRRLYRGLGHADRRGALLCAGLHLHHRAAAGGVRGRDRGDPPSQDVDLGARAPSGSRRRAPNRCSPRPACRSCRTRPTSCRCSSAIRSSASRRATCCSSEHGIYIQPINYPTVAKGSERLRITPSPYHDDALIDELAEALVDVWEELSLPFNQRALAAE